MDVDVNVYQTLKLFGAPHVGVGSAGFAVAVKLSCWFEYGNVPIVVAPLMSSFDDGTVDWTEKENVGRGVSEPRRK